MKRIKFFLLFFFLIFTNRTVKAQLTETQGWFFLSHTQTLNKKFDLLADVQTRSSNHFNYLTTLLLRGALSYNITTKHSVAVGYAYKGDWEKEDLMATIYGHENRIYEQYIYKFKIRSIEMMFRTRLEQRWVMDELTHFSQRGRLFLSAQIPLIADTAFNRGPYLGVQNEVFLNIQHKDRVNNAAFDQNRAFGSFGYRFSKKIDAELGYLFWYQKEMDASYRRNVFQLMLTTHF
ncbi:DUF2490 domain-containing protein [Mucilaginibacter sp. CSA2-8R]|uniref:DUF2490 domain-containing protein n=1 Tax=Mucilaginibacter sp. CSA2-8R TaxID=3141542 RepID=UPI00315DF8DD